ncbi:SDR family NAD(P)-dependent oxidoreductase [Opacimonas viscosa]|uniref:SDR family NAD(P)-dependent oxidoreductase n=1 Tax=Opacimonas viscosa TaxID=2961944 RepID=A0AA41WZY9_9ALTE|nr:SDR family NAD(P)-dependent oxidoreductase [Opacimonas viscosa]MCP3429597.1 SDR family NAD(P)-dependent oxidoreductase [Opacimonas viscosa]
MVVENKQYVEHVEQTSAESYAKDTHKVVIVTGGASGIGLGLVQHYLSKGYVVAVFDITSKEDLSASQDPELQSVISHPNTYFINTNIANNASVQAAVTQVHNTLGAPHIVVNCAGILRAGPFTSLTADDFSTSYQINVLGTRHLAAACLPLMRKGGRFAMVASMAGTIGIFGYTAYGSSKFAVLGFAQCLRAEYARTGISISVICPPEIDTPMVVAETRTMHPATRILKSFAGRLTLDDALPVMIKGISQRRFMIIPGWQAKMTFWLNRLTPIWLQNRVMDFLIKRHS